MCELNRYHLGKTLFEASSAIIEGRSRTGSQDIWKPASPSKNASNIFALMISLLE
jgi:hypothetical protein